MKGNKKILVIAILLLLISVTFSTYAIYKTAVSGNGTATAAAWTVAFSDGQNSVSNNFSLTFGSSDCDQANDGTSNHVAAGKIAPGVVCTKTITVDATGTETDVLITGALNGDVTATKNSQAVTIENSNDIDVDISTDATNDIITFGDSTRTATVTVTLTWNGDEGANYDGGDTSLAGATFTVPITLTAKQYLGS